MKKMLSVILSSVLMLGLCGAAYEIKPAETKELPLSDMSTVINAEKLMYQNPFNPRLGTRPESHSSGKSTISGYSNVPNSQGPANMPYYGKESLQATSLADRSS